MDESPNDGKAAGSPSGLNVELAADAIAEAESLVIKFGGDKYESHSPAVRLSSLKMALLIDHVRQEERAKLHQLNGHGLRHHGSARHLGQALMLP